MFSRAKFAKQIRQALENLYDFAYLQNLTLTNALSQSGQSLDRTVRQLRAELVDAIEQLKPANNVSPYAKERRPYQLLYGRYVQGMTTTELVEELKISVRQLRREQKRALAAITELMWNRLADRLEATPSLTEPPTKRREAAEIEAEQLINQAQVEDIRLSMLLHGALATLNPVAAKHGVTLLNQLPHNLPAVRADRVILRQAFMSLISFAMSKAEAGQVVIEGDANEKVNLSITATGRIQVQARAGVSLDVSRQLMTSFGGKIDIVDTPEQWQATISLPLAEYVPILVMDDNVGLLELFRRYLSGWNYQVLEAHTVDQASQIASEAHLKLILLDIMMPHQDGWEILQQLRNTPETREVPIVICSVLNEPELATALGASDYLPKPVTQDALLTKVEQWCGAPPKLEG